MKGRIVALARRLLPGRFDARRVYGPHVDIHPSAVILPTFRLDLRNPVPGRCYLRVGADCMIGGTFIFESTEGLVTLGERVFFGASTVICRTRVELASDIFVAWGGYLYDHDSHSLDYRERQNDLRRQLADHRSGQADYTRSKDWGPVNAKPIRVRDNAWLGMECLVMKGVNVGEGAIVGARAVVTRDVAPWTIVGGNPAVALKEIPPELRRTAGPHA